MFARPRKLRYVEGMEWRVIVEMRNISNGIICVMLKPTYVLVVFQHLISLYPYILQILDCSWVGVYSIMYLSV